MDPFVVIAVLAVVGLAVFVIAKTAIVVPQQAAYGVETLGRYSRTLPAGFHILMPFVDRVAYRHELKEQTIDIAEQVASRATTCRSASTACSTCRCSTHGRRAMAW